MIPLEPGTVLPELRITPEANTTVRYAAASGDFNPIHVDEAFARSVGLPGCILHGLWTMAQVARAQTEGLQSPPGALRRLSVEFRGLGLPEVEIVVSLRVSRIEEGTVHLEGGAKQSGKRIVRNAVVELDLGWRAARSFPHGPTRFGVTEQRTAGPSGRGWSMTAPKARGSC